MIAELFDEMINAGFNPPDASEYGRVIRFQVGDKPNKNGWLYIFDDGKGAVFGDWRTDSKFTWFQKGITQDVAKRNDAIKKAIADRDHRYKQTAIKAQRIFNESKPCQEHGYLKRKEVAACYGLRISQDGRLIVPVFNCADEKLQSLQFIDSDGNKRFLVDGRMKGGCFIIGELERGKKAYLCEGLATGLTIREATNTPVIVAFNAGNLKQVHDAFKKDVTITICADNDPSGKGEQAAAECGSDYIMPPSLGDFNDLGVERTQDILLKRIKKPFLITIEQLLTGIKPIDWLMKGIIERGSLGIVLGESGAGKSLFVLDWVCCLANGTNWHNFKVREPKKVVYVCGEGGRGIASRVQAIKQKYKTRIKNNAYFSTSAVDLLNSKSRSKITQTVTELDVVPDLIVFDTLHKSMTGDENSAKDIAVLFAAIAELQDLYGCAVIIVHHSGLADKMRGRGSSSIKAGVDFEYLITKNNDYELSIQCTKMKDYKKITPLKFMITPVELDGDQWIDEDGERSSSVFLTYSGVDSEKVRKLSQRDEIALNALKQALKDIGKPNKGLVLDCDDTTIVVIESLYRDYFNATCKGKNKARDYEESLKSLVSRRYASKGGGFIWLLDEND